MEAQANIHQVNQLLDYIKKTHTTYGRQIKDGKLIFDILENSSDLSLGHKKPIIPFKNILFKKLLEPNSDSCSKIALIGLNNCDVWSLHYLLEEFKNTAILPKREDIIIVSTECFADENCFCDLVGANKVAPFDLHIQHEKGHYSIFSGSVLGKNLLEKNGIKQSAKKMEMSKIALDQKQIPEKKLSEAIDNKEKFIEFWNKISQNCFGCGACSAVCPLCFCTRQEFKNELTGESKMCMNWDSCFGKQFSEIQNHFDFRPENVDRLYNWYNHKFVRSYFKNKRFLCTGCGRCIEACPAHLNQKNILESIIKQDEN